MRRRYAPSRVISLPPNRCNGYQGALQHILDINDEPFIYSDDDLKALTRVLRFDPDLDLDKRQHVRQHRWAAEPLTSAEEQGKLLLKMLDAVNEPYVACCSPHPVYIPKLERLISTKGRRHGQLCTQFMAINPSYNIPWDDGTNSPISDGVFNCRVLDAGLDCIWLSEYTSNCAPMFEAGGSGDYADRKKEMADAHFDLARQFPDLVKLRTSKDGKFSRFGGKHKIEDRDYYDVPVTFYRLSYLRQRRSELGYPPLEEFPRITRDYFAFDILTPDEQRVIDYFNSLDIDTACYILEDDLFKGVHEDDLRGFAQGLIQSLHA